MIIYQVLTRLFSTGRFSSFNNDGLKYIKSLSVTHIWYTGVIRHSENKTFVKGDWGSPYSISNYYDINPYLADVPSERLSEFCSLIERTHAAGMKVIIDFVPNHVSPDYTDEHGGLKTLHRHDYDWTDTDKVDYSCSLNWYKMLDIIRYWAELGVDGFRCDMAELVPIEFWHFLISNIKAEFPNLLFIAEVYQKDNYRKFIEDALCDKLYDKSGLYDTLRALTCGYGSARGITANWQSLGDLQPKMLNFLENHDEQRLASKEFAGSAASGYAALAVSALFYPAAFMLYAGQEIGEDAADGVDGRTSIFSHTRPIDLSGISKEQKNILEVYRKVLKLKSSMERASNFDLCYCQSPILGFDPDHHFVFLRKGKSHDYLVACNFSHTKASIVLNVPSEAASRFSSEVNVDILPMDFTILTK